MLLYTRITRNKILPIIFLFSNIILKVNLILLNLLFSLQIFLHQNYLLVIAFFKPRKTHLQKGLLSLNGTRSLMIFSLCVFVYMLVNAQNINYQLSRIWETIIEF